MRSPKRTASTAAALMIGLGLVSFVSIFAASIKTSSNQALAQTLKADYIVTNQQFSGFSLDVAARLKTDAAFSAVEEFRQGVFGYKGGAQQIQGVDPSQLTNVLNVPMQAGSVAALGQGEDNVLVYKETAKSNDWKVGDVIPAQFARTGIQRLKIVGIFTDNRLLGNYVVTLATYQKNFTEQLDEVVLLRAVGMARRQVRTMIRWESVIIAVFGAVLGAAVGIFFGWAMVRALKDQGITALTVPAGQLITYVVIAGVFGVIAAVLPARRAAKLDVLAAISTE